MSAVMVGTSDVIVIGAGISGAAFARRVAASGRRVLAIERDAEPGGCMKTAHGPDDAWCELGAHTLYSSYGAIATLIEEAGLSGDILPRLKVPYRVLRGDGPRPVGGELAKLRLLWGAWRLLARRKTGDTVAMHFRRIVGGRNYDRVFSRLFAAVPSQPADDFPADMLFKKRPRRKDLPRSFTLRGGLGRLPAALLAHPAIETRTGLGALTVSKTADGFAVGTASETFIAPRLALAVPAPEAARLATTWAPDLAARLAGIAAADVDSVAVLIPAGDVRWPPLAGAVPLEDDLFFAFVTRDVVPDAGGRRAFTFHFRPGLTEETRLTRVCEVLGVARHRLLAVATNHARLPSPRVGHADKIKAIDALLPSSGVYLCGNYFSGLSLEDCAQRAIAEAARLRLEAATAR